MKRKIFVLFLLCGFVLSAVSVGFADPKDDKKAKNTNQLLAILPASDGVVTIDAKRFFGQALPQILSANQPLLTDLTGQLDAIKTATGIDYKKFDQIAIGVNAVKISETRYNFEPLILARGQYNAAGLLAVAKIASNGKYREEKIGERTVYVFSAKEIIEQHRSKITNSMIGKLLDKILAGLNDELALTAYDANTVAVGSLPRVREIFEGKTRLSAEVLDLVSRKPNAVVNFGARVPNGLAKFFDLDNDEIGKNLDAVRSLSGSMDVIEGNTAVSFSAKTLNAEQAKGLKETLDGLQMLGKAFLGGSKSPDKKVYGRMVENARIAQLGNEVTIDLLIPQSDLNVIVGAKK
ncbi:MAG TPA: hypothetical protein VGC97_09140 [Pyrinomonadaceae bacterium]|jgi:hypothetical protein